MARAWGLVSTHASEGGSPPPPTPPPSASWSRGWSRALALLGVLTWALLGVAAVLRQTQARSADFREFYRAARDLLGLGEAGVTVPFTYPPTFHAIVAPLAHLPLGLAASLWFVLCSAAAALAVWALHRIGEERGPAALIVPVLLSAGLMVNDLVMGNANLLVLACLALGALGLCRGRPGLAGAAVTFGAALKLLPVLMLPYVLIRGRSRALAGALVGLGVGLLLPLLLLGVDPVMAWGAHALAAVGGDDDGAWFARDDAWRGTNQSLIALLHRFLRPIPAIRGQEPMGTVNLLDLPASTVEILGIGLVGLLVAALCGVAWRAHREDPALVYGLLVIGLLLVSRITWVNYLVFLLVPHFAAWQAWRAVPAGSPRRRWLGRGLLASLGCGIAGATPLTQALGIPALGAALLGCAIAWVCVACPRQRAALEGRA